MDVEALLAHVVGALEAEGVPYMLTGSLAAMIHGEPRLTNDIDLVADLTVDRIAPLAARFPPEEFYFDEAMAAEAVAQRGQFNVIHPASGLKIDLILPRAREFSACELARRQRVAVSPGLSLDIARAEDVIIAKLEAHREGGSEKHLRDIRAMLTALGDEVDRGYIAGWAERLGVTDLWAAAQRLY